MSNSGDRAKLPTGCTGFGDCDCDACFPPERVYPLADAPVKYRKLGWVFNLRTASWGIWFDRVDASVQIAWRLNIGPLHIVRLK